MGITDQIKEIEYEMSRTQKNKATNYHLGTLKGKLARLRSLLLTEGSSKGGSTGEGFEVGKFGDGRVALIGFPSVGKSTLLNELTGNVSEVASYEFTTLTCIPGIIRYKDTKIQMLDLPGIIEGASEGKGRGRQVISVAKSSDLILIVLDAGKGEHQAALLEKELNAVGIRLNQDPPDITYKPKKTGGVKFNATVPLTHCDEKLVQLVLHDYKIHNAEVLFRGDYTVDQFIDIVEGQNRKYIKCLYCYNKIDTITMEEVDRLARRPHCLVMSMTMGLNKDYLLERMWEYMGLRRVYTKPKGSAPDLNDPLVLTNARGGYTVERAADMLHRDIKRNLKYALVWGASSKHAPQMCGLDHLLADEDCIQLVMTQKQETGSFKKGIWIADNAGSAVERHQLSKEKKAKLKS